MRAAIMQPYFFPYIGYWQLISAVDTFIIYDDVNYMQKSYINRNSILLNKEPHMFTLETSGASQNRLINEVKVGTNKKKLLKTISFAYKKAPHFKEVYPLIQEILENQEQNLAKFIGFSIEKIAHYMDLKTDFLYSSQIKKHNSLKGEAKIIDILKHLQIEEYINAIGGESLYSTQKFSGENIDLKFLKTQKLEYFQNKESFTPSLSIIDILMFNTQDEIKKIISKYVLI